MRPLAGTALENLLDSLLYSVDFLSKLPPDGNGPALFGETAVQVIREYYLYKKGQFLPGGVGEAVAELGLPFGQDEVEILVGIEKAMRLEEDYVEFLPKIRPENRAKITQSLREILK